MTGSCLACLDDCRTGLGDDGEAANIPKIDKTLKKRPGWMMMGGEGEAI